MATLVGGTNHSLLSVFQSLGLGTNDGKIKAIINGTTYDNIAISLASTSNLVSQTQTGNNNLVASTTLSGQSFTMGSSDTYIKSVELYIFKQGNPSGNFEVYIYGVDVAGAPTGSALKSVSVAASTISTSAGFVSFDINLSVSASTKYAIVAKLPNGDVSTNRVFWSKINSSVYSGGTALDSTNNGSTWNVRNSQDCTFKVNKSTAVSSLANIASTVQTAIRAVTSSTETVTYNTDHFEATASTSISITTPSTGTDISGSGSTPYLAFPSPTSIKSWNGLAKASVKSVNGLAIVSVKSINGLT